MKQLFRGMKFSLAITFAIFAMSFAFTGDHMVGKSFAESKQPANVVKVEVRHKNVSDVGSGSLIRSDLILTANHVIRERRGGSTKIHFSSGLVREGEVIKTSVRWDLALVRIEPVLYPVLRPAKTQAVRGQSVTICGFPAGERYREITGRVKAFADHDWENVGGFFWLDKKSYHGMSGGPALNREGDMVGLMWGSDDHAHCTGLKQIKKFLEGVK